MSYYTDADIEMVEAADASNMRAAGICHICTDRVNHSPDAPAWARPCSWDEASHQQCRDEQAADLAEIEADRAEVAAYRAEQGR